MPRDAAIRASTTFAAPSWRPLHHALTDGKPIGLDFIYGEENDGTFEPLDGQQRLTTLFLLHWYLAFRSGRLGDPQPWTRFTYATRPGARLFCKRIVENPPPADLPGCPSLWIKDQSWYLYLWRFDPTIQAMLVMLDAIAGQFQNDDLDAAWERLTDERRPSSVVPAPPDRRDRFRGGSLHQDELPREAADRVRDV